MLRTFLSFQEYTPHIRQENEAVRISTETYKISVILWTDNLFGHKFNPDTELYELNLNKDFPGLVRVAAKIALDSNQDETAQRISKIATEILLQKIAKETYPPSFPEVRFIKSLNEIQERIENSLEDHFFPLQIEIPQEMHRFSCFQYALTDVGEVVKSKDCKTVTVLSTLFKRGFAPVEEPKQGDLVLYLLDNGMPMHMGVYQGDGKVKSKFGLGVIKAYLHPMEEALLIYGKNIIYWRKIRAT